MEGRLQIRNFDAKDGTKHWVTEIIASNVEFVERKSESANRNQQYGQQYPGPDTGAAEPAVSMAKSPMGGMGSDVPFDEEVPF